ncbi:MAG: dienelactone hydrolase family protein [Pseudomonadota bacterium]|nr:dienelactone hydrolase family protein [Pseudomonadota bacterium]
MTKFPKLSGPIMGPVSGITKSIVVLLHGYGANGDDLIGLAPALSAALPDTLFVAPNAPYPCAQNPFGGLQWFNVLEENQQDRLSQIRAAASIIDAFVDSELKRLGVDENKLAFLGFSQGTMLSLHVGLRRSNSPAGILGYSGRLEAPELLVDEISVRPPVLLIHGEDDPLIPVNLMGVAADSLIKNGVKVDTHNRHGLQHGIDQEGVKIGADFLQSVLL